MQQNSGNKKNGFSVRRRGHRWMSRVVARAMVRGVVAGVTVTKGRVAMVEERERANVMDHIVSYVGSPYNLRHRSVMCGVNLITMGAPQTPLVDLHIFIHTCTMVHLVKYNAPYTTWICYY